MKFLSANAPIDAVGISVTVILVVFSLICMVGLIVGLCRFADYGGEVKNIFGFLAAGLAVGLALRLTFALCIRGYRADYSVFTSMFNSLKVNGTKGYYKGDASAVLYPVPYFFYLIFGGLSNVMGLSDHALGMQFMIKLPMIIADLVTACVIYKLAAVYWTKAAALVMFLFVCVCPIFYIGSSIWCTQIAFTVMFACLTCYCLARKKLALTVAFASAAAYSSKEGIYLFPIVATFVIYHTVRAAINIKRDGVRGAAVLGGDYRAVVTVPTAVMAAFILSYLIALIPMHSYSANPFRYIYELTIEPLTSWAYFTRDGLSIYSVFDRSFVQRGARFPSWLFVCIFAAIISAVVCIVYFTKRNRATMVMLIGFSFFTMQIYYPDSTAVSMQSTIAVLLAGYALTRDKRILTVIFVAGIAYAVNSTVTLVNMYQMNNLNNYQMTELGALPTSGIKAVTITCSVVAAVAHLYYTVIAVNIGMTGQKRLLGSAKGLGASLKEYFSFGKR